MMQGCHTSPPPFYPMVSPLACQVGSCLVWPCCFPRLVLFGLVPVPPCPPSLWLAWVRSGCAGPLGAGAARGRQEPGARGRGPARGGGGIP